MPELPAPLALTLFDIKGKVSLNRPSLVYKGRIGWWRFRRIRQHICTVANVVRVRRKKDGPFTLARIEINRHLAHKEVAKTHFALLEALQPQLRFCLAELFLAQEGKWSGAVVEVTCMHSPYENRKSIGPALRRALEPFGGKVEYLNSQDPHRGPLYRFSITPFTPPDDFGPVLTERLRSEGFFLGTWGKKPFTKGEFLGACIPGRVFGAN
jgi:hypothetical protein